MSESVPPADESAAPKHPNFADASEVELFEWMALGKSSPNESRAAFAEFHRRHAGFIYGQCERRYRAEAEDIVGDTLVRVYEGAGTFNPERAGGAVTPAAVRAWALCIAHNVAADRFTERTSGPKVVTPERITSLPDRTCADPSKERPVLDAELIGRVRQVVEELSELHQEVAWVIAHRWCLGSVENRWTPEDIDAIAVRFGLERENIRQIKSRLIKKLRALLTPVLGGSGSGR